jgi:serine/threonine protein kinase
MSRCARCFGDLHNLAVFCPHCAQVNEPDFDQLIDQIIDGRYRIDRRLGQGGLSTVFAATDLLSDQIVVIKISDPVQLARRDLSYTIDSLEARSYWAEMIDRMRREAEELVTLDHPNIVGFRGTGMVNDDLRYVVMDFLRGRTLRDEITNRRRIEFAETLRIAFEIISGLKEVHSRGIVHRDINPSNIFIESVINHDNGTQTVIKQTAIKLIDFGIAKFPQPPGAPPFTRYSVMSGTVAYASPEQCQNRPLDYRTDIYSLGVVLYEMLTGQRPFTGRTPTEIALNQIQSQPISLRAINPYLPPGLERVILRALAKTPGERQQSVGELARELRAAMSNQIIIPLKTETIVERLDRAFVNSDGASGASLEESPDEKMRLARRRRRRAAIAAAALLVLSAGGVLLGRHLIKPQPTVNPEMMAASASPSPDLTATPAAEDLADLSSDEDAMETAARLLQEGIKEMSTLANPTPQPSGSPIPLTATEPGTSRTAPGTQSAIINGLPAPPKAQPQTPPMPAPSIVATRVVKPESEPDISQAPRKEEENSPQNGNSPDQNDSDRSEGGYEDRHRANTSGVSRRPQRQPEREARAENDNRDDGSPYDDEGPLRIGPRLIQWNGDVFNERVIKIEMPGVPGTIEIPRVYRDRVGVIESPSHSNNWRYAVLRVFGQGPVTILVRWWPMSSKMANISVRQ